MQDIEHGLVQVNYEGQTVEVTPEVAAALMESDREISSQQRQKRRKHILESELLIEKAVSDSQSFDGSTDSVDIFKLREALSTVKLSEKQRRRLKAYYFDSLTYREIAAMEGVSVKSAFESVQYALKKIKKFFQKHPTKHL